MTFTLHFGALCDPIGEQLIKQGYSISEEDSKRIQGIVHAIIMLKLHGVIPDSVVRTSEQKLMKLICSAESLAEVASPTGSREYDPRLSQRLPEGDRGRGEQEMSKSAKIERTQKAFLAAMRKKFSEDPTIPTTKPFLEPVKQEHVILMPLTDPTMNGTKDPVRKREKLRDRIECLRAEIAMREDQIAIMMHEIAGLGK